MKTITREMLKIYKPKSGMDWLNYKIVRKEDMTYHHILKCEAGGKATFDNGALLLTVPHQYLHIIEYKDIETYIAINKMFELINKQKAEPTMEQRQILEYLLKRFEYDHRDDKNSKGKSLIKYEYLKRQSL